MCSGVACDGSLPRSPSSSASSSTSSNVPASPATPLARRGKVSSPLLERRRGRQLALAVNCATAVTEAASQCQSDDSSHRAKAFLAQEYTVLGQLGQGSSSVVYEGVSRTTGQQVALKVVRTSDEEVAAIAEAEYSLLKRIEHPNIVRATNFLFSGTAKCCVLVMNLFHGCELGLAVSRHPQGRLPEVTARSLFKALLEALDYLHRRRILHRDVKPENVLVNSDFSDLQLVDFNIGCYLPESGSLSPRCTPMYAPPEVLKGSSGSDASDIWGAGVCLCTMLSGQSCVLRGKVDISSCTASEPCTDILRSCLAEDHSMRPAAMTLLKTQWVNGIPSEENTERPQKLKRPQSSSPSRRIVDATDAPGEWVHAFASRSCRDTLRSEKCRIRNRRASAC